MLSYRKYSKASETPLTAAATIFLVVYSWQIIGNLENTALKISDTIIFVTWLLFLADYAVKLFLAKQKFVWFYKNIPDLLIVALPMLRPLRLLRLLTVIKSLQKNAKSAFRGKILTYVIGASILLTYISALAILDAESGVQNSSINTFPDALWWALVTITTVGYGDLSPVTSTGRIIAVGVMVSGISLIGVLTASLASWIVEKVSQEDQRQQNDTNTKIEKLTQQITKLQKTLEEKK